MQELRRSPTLRDYRARPRGAYYLDESFCVFDHPSGTGGLIVWGNPTTTSIERIARAREPDDALHAPQRLILDYGLLDNLDREAFAVLEAWEQTHGDRIRTGTVRVVVILPGDRYTAALLHGSLNHLQSSASDMQFVDTLASADSYVGMDVCHLISELRRTAGAGTIFTTRVVRALSRDPRMGMGQVARSLGTTVRTLQRRLMTEMTTFSVQARAAKVRMAKHLLATTDEHIGVIARAIGCPSGQYFSQMFRAETRMTPRDWRAAVQASDTRSAPGA